MQVLWITNIVFPEAQKLLSGAGSLKSSGGWMLGAANALLRYENVNLTVATVSSNVKQLTRLEGKKLVYYLIPYGKGNISYNKEYEPYWIKIREEVCPDVVHIHGSESSQGLAYVNACGADKVVLSIQGLKSSYWKYYHSGMTNWEILKNITFHDIFARSIFNEKRRFKKSGALEMELISKINHIIGRTSWDRALTWSINPNACYHFCNETLRDEFYDGSMWDYSNCDKHTIFLSQANYPIKGLHQALKAMPIIIRHFPDTIIRVAGRDLTRNKGVKGMMHYNGYMKYINSLLNKNDLRNHVVYTGALNAEEMKKEYLRCNVFVCPSSIENSPNSLGEAQILGVPCVASYVGGIMDMMKGDEINMYRFEEVDMLAEKICNIFKCSEPNVKMVEVARERHSPDNNSATLFSIYKSIL